MFFRTFPYKKNDPLIFNDKIPDVYVSGGEKEFFTATTKFTTKNVTVIGLSDFFVEFSIALLDLQTNKVIEYKLK